MHARRCEGIEPPLRLADDGSLVAGWEGGPEAPDGPWVEWLYRGFALIEAHGPHGALVALGAESDGFDPVFWQMYEHLKLELDLLEAEGRELAGAKRARERKAARREQ